MERQAKVTKPPYRLPTMAEIEVTPLNGLKVASTFSGCGGSCLGYRMAGFKIVWANEFNSDARDSYRLNFPDTYLDPTDIRQVSARDIFKTTGLKRGELDLFDGSPPCQSFSTSGKREKGWGKSVAHSDGTTQISDDLFFEYARLLKELQPKVFVAENVTGLVIGSAKGYFKIIHRALVDCGYKVEARILDASWLGVPQARRRVIFVGVRNDIDRAPAFPKPQKYQYTLGDACPWIVDSLHKNSGFFTSMEMTLTTPIPTLTTTGTNEYMALGAHPAPKANDDKVDFEIKMLGRAAAKAWAETKVGKSHHKFFNAIKASPNLPSPTLLAHASSHDVAHPYSPRRFTIHELKLLSSFPRDFQLAGTFEKRWARIGNAVPPLMMFHVARAVRDDILIRA